MSLPPSPEPSRIPGQRTARELMLSVFRRVHERVANETPQMPLGPLRPWDDRLEAGDFAVVRVADPHRREAMLHSMLQRDAVRGEIEALREALEREHARANAARQGKGDAPLPRAWGESIDGTSRTSDTNSPPPAEADVVTRGDDGPTADADDDRLWRPRLQRLLVVTAPDAAHEQLRGLLATLSGVPREVEPTEVDFLDLIHWADNLAASDLTVDDGSPLLDELLGRIRAWSDLPPANASIRHGTGLVVFYDLTHLRRHSDADPEPEDAVLRTLSRWARELRVPMVAFASPSRDGAAVQYSLWRRHERD